MSSGGTGWEGSVFEVRLGAPGHGGFCVGRHEGRVMFVRHGLPGELVRARVTEDRGGSFCRAEAIEILEASPDRVPATCPVSGPGGAGCCDFSFATPRAQRALKAAVVTEQLRRLAGWETEVVVEPIPLVDNGFPSPADGGWRTRVRLAVDADGRAGVHRYRSTEVIPDLRCPQPVPGAMSGLADRTWTPGAELVVAVDGDGLRHIVELAPPKQSGHGGAERGSPGYGGSGRGEAGYRGAGRGSAERGGAVGGEAGRGSAGRGEAEPGDVGRGSAGRGGSARGGAGREEVGRGEAGRGKAGRGDAGRGGDRRRNERYGNGFRAGDRRATAARRAAAHAPRHERVVEGSGRAVQYVAGRRWEVSATGFWQPHRGAAQCYSDVVAEWADASTGALAWDLYCGAGVFAARLADQVGATGSVLGVESARSAVADGAAALRDLPWVRLTAGRVERWLGHRTGSPAPQVVVLDPPRAGAGKDVIAATTANAPARIIHIGCDPASFARDIALYRTAGYHPTHLRAFDAFPTTHHVECLALLERT
ncbi:class I SAM-dependent RNA methyltransferase [Nocardia wallacei]|uniref:class I SAM-dependent RNA methyltransferase n=1 Tax=Nocardia wallacei TaxID=480035 RepID=UPI0024565E0F|nr:TRAM domain-containing protein [Nocardia wallacei]